MTEEMKLKRNIDRIITAGIDDAAKLKKLDNLRWKQVGDQAAGMVKAVMLTFSSYTQKVESQKRVFSAAIKVLRECENDYKAYPI